MHIHIVQNAYTQQSMHPIDPWPYSTHMQDFIAILDAIDRKTLPT